MKFQQARNFRKGRTKKVDLVGIHTMECPEQLDTAEKVAGWFAGIAAPPASAHYCVDVDSVVQCVKEEDVAWHAKGGDVNARSIGIEMAGYAKQTPEQWADDYSTKMLDRTANLVADICARHNLPIKFVDAAGLLAGERGITTHREVTKAYKVVGGHVDPGPNFPMYDFVIKVLSYQVYPDEIS